MDNAAAGRSLQRRALWCLWIGALLWTAPLGTALAQTYHFETLSTDPVSGQDGWVQQAGLVEQTAVTSDATAANGTQVLRYTTTGALPSLAVLTRLNNSSFGFLPFRNTAVAVIQFDLTAGPLAVFALGHDVDGDGGLRVGTGEIGPAFAIGALPGSGELVFRLAAADLTSVVNAPLNGGDRCCNSAGDWYRLQLRVDLTANGGDGAGSLSYLNLTAGESTFRPISELQDVNLQLGRLQPGASPAFWDTMLVALRSDGQGGAASVDNLVPRVPPTPPGCGDVLGRRQLNVLTLNLLFSQDQNDRERRYPDLARFIAETPVDVVLLQEVASGALVDTNSGDDTAEKLRDLLRDRYNVLYDLRRKLDSVLPSVLSVGNAILSRCRITFDTSHDLPAQAEAEIQGITVKLPRSVLMTALEIPGFRDIHVYDTHLCARCDQVDDVTARREQLEDALDFIDAVETTIPDANPVVLGGDFNLDIFRDRSPGELFGPEKLTYDVAISRGFTDAYAEPNDPTLLSLCETPEVPDEHCTVDVTEIDTPQNPSGRRVDYVFTRPLGVQAFGARVVFNTLVDPVQPTVSNHAGAYVEVGPRR